MSKFILSVVVASLTIGVAVAGPGSKGNSGGNHSSPPSMGSKPSMPTSNFKVTNTNYHLTFGKSFSGGILYQGKNHNHWSYSCFCPKFGCTCYWCPSTLCYYYWCEPACCYYPITYIAVAPPVLVQVQVQVAAPVTQGPPAGIPPLPQ
ncbi:MAG TPA: hypothetical protein VHR66_12725 [Gemmataceae bacterium]|jgi:hypothetical protein|nr:hypothetical protein [Gemmataceae bacterium]